MQDEPHRCQAAWQRRCLLETYVLWDVEDKVSQCGDILGKRTIVGAQRIVANPAIAPFSNHLQVPTEAVPWPAVPAGTPLRASVNSFGFGGTNAHVILESFEAVWEGDACDDDDPYGPFILSAQTENSLADSIKQLVQHIQEKPGLSFSDMSSLPQLRRSVFPTKTTFSATSREGLIESMQQHLADVESGRKPIGLHARLISQAPEVPGTLAIFTGQGGQWPKMGAELLRSSAVFRNAIQQCERSLSSCPDPPSWSLREELLTDAPQSRVSEAELSQPLCTAVQIGLVDLLFASGVKLDAVVGHSSGEIAATYAAGILTAADAIRIAYYRGLYVKLAFGAQGQKGAMLAVAIPYDDSEDFCKEDKNAGRLATAASNSPSSVTMSGDIDAIEEAKNNFDKQKILASTVTG